MRIYRVYHSHNTKYCELFMHDCRLDGDVKFLTLFPPSIPASSPSQSRIESLIIFVRYHTGHSDFKLCWDTRKYVIEAIYLFLVLNRSYSKVTASH